MPAMLNRDSEHRVAILASTSSFGRRILKGISTYVRPTRTWSIHIGQSLARDDVMQLREWKPTGVIAHIGSAETAELLSKWRLPTVNVSSAIVRNEFPRVGIDDMAIGSMAGQHLLEKSVTRFAFCGDLSLGYARDRRDGFRNVIGSAGYEVIEFPWPTDTPMFVAGIRRALGRAVEHEFGQWLEALPKPIGILVAQDALGFTLCEVCRQAGLQVPEDVAIIGVDDDDLACGFANPPISSVRSPLEMVGYEAARVLDDLFLGKLTPPESIIFQPSAVTERQSTNITANNDPLLATALRFIRDHAHVPIQVDDVLDEVVVSRRSLETKFKKLLGRTPLQEIHRVHVEQAKRLLTETKLPVPRVAESSGFSSAEQMNIVFQRQTGVSPSTYRLKASNSV